MDIGKQDEIANRTVRMTLSAMQSGIGQMILTGTSKVLKLPQFPRQPVGEPAEDEERSWRKLQPADIEQLNRSKAWIDKAISQVDKKRPIANFGMKTICDCPVHIKCLGDVKISSLQDFVRADPLLLKYALRKAERAGVPPQLHLYVLLVSKAETVGNQLTKLMLEKELTFPVRESLRGC